MQRFSVERVLPAPIETVWALYTDHKGWAKLLGNIRVELSPEGSPDPNGVGCVRHIFALGMEMVAEEVTVFEPPTRMKYRVLRGGGPIRNHDGEVLFVAVPGGTQVTWRVEFEPTIPGLGPAIKAGVRAFFVHFLTRMEAQLRK